MPSLTDRLRGLLGGQRGITASLTVGGHPWNVLTWDFVNIVSGVYAQNPTGYRCIETLTNNFSRPDWLIRDPNDDSVIEKSPLLDLLNAPWPGVSGTAMQRAMIRDLKLTGRSFLLKMQGTDGFGNKGPTTGLRRLPVQRVTVVGNHDDDLIGFIYSDRRGQIAAALPESVVYLRYPHPERAYDGLAPAIAAGLPAQIDVSATRFNLDLLANDGALPGIITVENLTPDEFQSWKFKWESGENPGKVRFLGGKASYTPIGQSNEAMAYKDLRTMSQEDIARCFGVNSVMLNPSDATYANLEQGKAMFMQQTVWPDWILVADELTQQIGMPEFGQKVDFDLSEIEELGDSKDKIIDRGVKLISVGAWSPNMLLHAIDEDDVPWGAVPLQPVKPIQGSPAAVPGQPAPAPTKEPHSSTYSAKEPVVKWIQASAVSTKASRQVGVSVDRVEAYEARFERKMRAFFARQGRVIVAKIRGQKSVTKASDNWWDDDRWNTELSDDSADMYSDIVDAFGTAAKSQMGGAAGAFDLNSSRVIEYMRGKAQNLTTLVNDTTEFDVRQIIADATAQGMSVPDMADLVRGYFSGDESQARYRAERVARTETIGASNWATLEAARQSGVATGKSWLTAGADDECADNESDGVIPLDGTFSTGDDSPPVHPNAVLAGTSFIAYGELAEMISAAYSGPAVFIRAGSKELTIGPNHPMLTARGLVRAENLREGDQLIYDLRFDNPALGGASEAHFEQVPNVEDKFSSLSSVHGHIAVAAPRYDLHGDRVFCKGEVQVVTPQRPLLDVPDLPELQELREGHFVLSDVETVEVSRLGSGDLDVQRIMLTSSRGMGGDCALDSVTAVAADHAASSTTVALATAVETRHPYMVAISVDVVGRTWFEGQAFDATTAGLYASNGFVVSNCRCTILIDTGDASDGVDVGASDEGE